MASTLLFIHTHAEVDLGKWIRAPRKSALPLYPVSKDLQGRRKDLWGQFSWLPEVFFDEEKYRIRHGVLYCTLSLVDAINLLQPDDHRGIGGVTTCFLTGLKTQS